MDLRNKLRSGMIAVTTGEKYLVLTDCNTVNYGRQTFCLVNATGFMTGNTYREDLSYRTEYYSINALYKATVDGGTYAMECSKDQLIWTREPKNLREAIISRRFLQ